jgi:REP element-mobilizing transposase RayT
MNELQFFNPYGEIRHTENRLPHWQQQGATYFVTFRLADSIPPHALGQWRDERAAWLRTHPEPWDSKIESEYHRRFSGALEQWLDQGHGGCLLRRPDCAKVVAETLRHFEGERVVMISFVVMPNHVHAVFVQNPEWPLEKLIRSWKGFAARQINKLLERSGSFWQRDYFDRLVRDDQHFANCVRYVRRNPEKARLTQDEFVLWESDLAKEIV